MQKLFKYSDQSLYKFEDTPRSQQRVVESSRARLTFTGGFRLEADDVLGRRPRRSRYVCRFLLSSTSTGFTRWSTGSIAPPANLGERCRILPLICRINLLKKRTFLLSVALHRFCLIILVWAELLKCYMPYFFTYFKCSPQNVCKYLLNYLKKLLENYANHT